jgi:hypothetical protein
MSALKPDVYVLPQESQCSRYKSLNNIENVKLCKELITYFSVTAMVA